jgi:hypothetical protein
MTERLMSIGDICVACPFRRRSVPAIYAVDHGVLARAAMQGLSQEIPIACVESNRAEGDIRACVGSLIFRKNAGLIWDLSPDEHRALECVEPDIRSVFTSIDEYRQHHSGLE